MWWPCARWRVTASASQSAYVGLTRQQLDDIMQERERQRDRLEAAAAAADRSVEIAQSYVVPAFERGRPRRAGACEGGGDCGLRFFGGGGFGIRVSVCVCCVLLCRPLSCPVLG